MSRYDAYRLLVAGAIAFRHLHRARKLIGSLTYSCKHDTPHVFELTIRQI